jgi:hypothetical protein
MTLKSRRATIRPKIISVGRRKSCKVRRYAVRAIGPAIPSPSSLIWAKAMMGMAITVSKSDSSQVIMPNMKRMKGIIGNTKAKVTPAENMAPTIMVMKILPIESF